MEEIITTVLANRSLARDTYRMELHCPQPEFFDAFRPGRFLQVAIPDKGECLLRRPFAVERVDRQRNRFTMVYVIRGKGSAALSELSPGKALSVLGPLGNGFDIRDFQKIWLVAGREGSAPLHSIAQAYPERSYHSFVGFAEGADIFDLQHMASYGPVTLCTDDGSSGYDGYAVDAVMDALDGGKDTPDVLFACGPGVMLAGLDRRLKERQYPVPCYISMESRMGCGTGVCLVCNCKVKANEADWQYKRACLEGPVFPIEEVIFDEIR